MWEVGDLIEDTLESSHDIVVDVQYVVKDRYMERKAEGKNQNI